MHYLTITATTNGGDDEYNQQKKKITSIKTVLEKSISNSVVAAVHFIRNTHTRKRAANGYARAHLTSAFNRTDPTD